MYQITEKEFLLNINFLKLKRLLFFSLFFRFCVHHDILNDLIWT